MSGKKVLKISRRFVLLMLVSLLIFGSLSAENTTPEKPLPQTAILLAPHCSEEQMQNLAKDALLDLSIHTKASQIEPQTYTITLNVAQMTFPDLTKKMQKSGCF